jgi:alkanesulfonate monooxygenase SsuD/methylene tetrahydromethanopterin reductase-like flavin-dependent oxidoreductase (luciferase family)
MKIGMTMPSMVAGLDRARLLDWARRIDAGPFSSLACGERITFPNQEIMVTMAAAAAVTERVRLTFTVLVLPLHATMLIAKQVATLDVLSAGRVTLGVGVGGREEDYRAVGAPFEHRARRLEEQVALLRRAWAGEAVVPDASPVGPRPVQPGGPEVLAGALMPASIRRAARWADGLCGFGFAPDVDEIASVFALARTAWRERDRPVPPRLVTSCWFALDPGGRGQMDAYVTRYLGTFGAETAAAMASVCTTTSAAALREVVRRVADTGADELILVPTTADPEEVDRVADLLG